VLSVPSSAPASTPNLFAGCDDTSGNPQPSHKCLTTDHMAAYFEASEETEYEVCLFQHVIEEIDCSPPTLAQSETLYQNSFTIDTPGDYEVVWFDTAAKTELGEWALTVESPPPPAPPPAPPVTPPVVAPVLPTVSTACLAAQKRLTTLRAKVRKAQGRQKAKLKARLKKARAAEKAAC
jgi:hypothetical protein